jgi:hypothetical protein
LVAALGAAGCADASAKVETNEAAPVQAPTAVETAKPAASGHGKGKDRPTKNARRGRMPAVFVDGEMVGVLKFQELPPSLQVTWVAQGNNVVDRRFKLAEYLTAVGVDLEAIKGVHLYGGRRVSAITGDEFRKKAHNIQFRFTREFSGRPAYKYIGRIEATTAIEKITRVAVYIDKPVPSMERGWPHVDGKRVDGVPYVAKKALKDTGTRVYLDGRLVGTLKRRHVKNAQSTVLADLLRDELEIDIDSVKRADIIGSRDKIAKKLDGEQLKDKALVVSAKGNGRVSVETVSDGRGVDAIVLVAKAVYVDKSVDAPEKFKVPGELPVIDDGMSKTPKSSK